MFLNTVLNYSGPSYATNFIFFLMHPLEVKSYMMMSFFIFADMCLMTSYTAVLRSFISTTFNLKLCLEPEMQRGAKKRTTHPYLHHTTPERHCYITKMVQARMVDFV